VLVRNTRNRVTVCIQRAEGLLLHLLSCLYKL